MSNLPYYEQKDIENIQKLRTMLKELPPFCTEYFRGIEPRTSTRTRIAYAYDLSVFFDFLKKENPVFSKMDRMDFRLEHLDQLTVTDLEEYMEYLKYRFNENNKEVINKERGIMRKISSLKSFYNYFFRVEKIVFAYDSDSCLHSCPPQRSNTKITVSCCLKTTIHKIFFKTCAGLISF